MTEAVEIHGWEFDFGKGVAVKKGREVRFKIKKDRVLKWNGSWWEGSFFLDRDQDVLSAYEHWQFERIVLK